MTSPSDSTSQPTLPDQVSSSVESDEPDAIKLIDITKRFGTVVANKNVTFSARRGEVHALIGENGAGKSTLMNMLAGMYRPDEGTLEIDGEVVTLRSPADSIARGIGMVHQHFMLVDSFTVTENVMMAQTDAGWTLDSRQVARELEELSERYGLTVDPNARIWQLSVGEQQRVEILRLLHRGAQTLVFDEPTAVLTPQEAAHLLRSLRQMAAQGFTIIFISHKLDEVLEVADRITVLRRGEVIGTLDPRETTRPELARMMVGRELAQTLLHDDAAIEQEQGPIVLSLEGVSANNDKQLPALDELSLFVRAGETLGIAGVAGNGQRELAEVITGMRPATRGKIMLGDHEITNKRPREIANLGVAHVPEDRMGMGLIGSLDLAENAILRTYRGSPISEGSFLRGNAISRFTDRLIETFDIKTSSRHASVRDLSGGNQQKLLIARELSGEPEAIVVVHPTRGVDVGASEAIHGVLREQRQRGAATLLISEDLDELLALSDRLAVIYEGRIMGTVPAREADIEEIGMMMAGTPQSELANIPAEVSAIPEVTA